MTPPGLTVALASAVAWMGVDASRKWLATKVPPAALVIALTLGQAPLYLALAWQTGRFVDGGDYVAPGLACLALNTYANLAFVSALARHPMSVTVPLLSLTPVLTAIVGWPLLGERPSSLEWLGISLVVVGAATLHAPGVSRVTGAGAEHRRALATMSTVALAWSLTASLDKRALAYASVGGHAFIQNLGIGLTLTAILVVRRRSAELRALRGAPLGLLLAIVLAAAAMSLQLLAIRALYVSIVETLKRALGMISAVVIGRVAFGEPITRTKLVGVATMLVGTLLLVFG